MTNDDHLVRQLIAGDTTGVRQSLRHRTGSESPVALVVAALVSDEPETLLGRASHAARSSRDRQLVAIAGAHLTGDEDRLAVLVRDHLVDHPDSLLAAWVAAQHPTSQEKP